VFKMTATAKMIQKSLEDLSDAEFEALLVERRAAMKGLRLTDDQRRKAETYSGPIDHGSDEIQKR
jgi:hypothetical protein